MSGDYVRRPGPVPGLVVEEYVAYPCCEPEDTPRELLVPEAFEAAIADLIKLRKTMADACDTIVHLKRTILRQDRTISELRSEVHRLKGGA